MPSAVLQAVLYGAYSERIVGRSFATLSRTGKSHLLIKSNTVLGTSANSGIFLTNCTDCLIELNYVKGAKANIELNNCQRITIRFNQLIDPGGALPRGQQILCDTCQNISILSNTMTLSGAGTPEDMVNLYQTGNSLVAGNEFSGWGVSTVATHIVIDGAVGLLSLGHNNVVRNNHCVNPTDGAAHGVGVGVAAGYGHTVENNLVVNAGNSAIYVWDQYPFPTDDFADGVQASPLWDNSYTLGTATKVEAGGVVTFTPPTSTAGSNYAAYLSFPPIDLTGRSVAVKVSGVTAGANAETFFWLQTDSGGANAFKIQKTGTSLNFIKIIASTPTTIATVVYSAVTHLNWRIREYGGTIFFDTSPSDGFSINGTVWTNRASVANPFAVTSMLIQLGAGTFASQAAPAAGVFDNMGVYLMRDVSVTNNTAVTNNTFFDGGNCQGLVKTGNSF